MAVSKDGISEHYLVSNKGRMARILPQWQNAAGYWVVHSSSRCKQYNAYVHRTLAQAFIRPCEKGEVVNHKDGNKSNNDLSNLEIVTKSRDCRHAIELGLKPDFSGKNNPNYKHGQRMRKAVKH